MTNSVQSHSDAALREHFAGRAARERAAIQEKRAAIRGPFYLCHPDVACGRYHDPGDLRWIERAWVPDGCLFGWVCRPTAVACCELCVIAWDGADLTLADFVAEHGP
ncbi:MAG: hypothetical protein F4Y02_17965 [Chloroflexi bacterium]|nr:hypothetical protein [Chloroflexota bacterium]